MEILQQNDYQPYGEKIPDGNHLSGEKNYLYCGKVFQSFFDLPFYDSGARFQRNDGIFLSVDPLAEKYYGISPYAYCAGNPVRYSDNDGNDRKDKVIGFAIGLATNVVPFSTGLRDQYSPTDPSDYNEALRAVDETVLTVGTRLTTVGGGLAAVGAGTMLIGGTTIVASGGTAAVEGGAVAVVGAEAVAVGTKASLVGVMLMGNSKANSSAGYGYGKTSGKNERHGDGGRSLIKAKKRTEKLQAQIKVSKSKKERNKLQTKIHNIMKHANDNNHGEEHSRNNKGG